MHDRAHSRRSSCQTTWLELVARFPEGDSQTLLGAAKDVTVR
jgi:hypothetical protein